MKEKLEKLGQIAVQTAAQGLLEARNLTQDFSKSASQKVIDQTTKGLNHVGVAASSVVGTGKSVQQSLQKIIEHDSAQELIVQVKANSYLVADTAAQGVKFLGSQVVDGVRKIDDKLEENHAEIKEKTEALSMGMGIAAGVAAGAAVVGPPIVVAAAPIIGAAATVSGAVAGSAYFYSKWKTKNKSIESSSVTNMVENQENEQAKKD